MATLIELFNLRANSELRNKVGAAVAVAAEAVRVEDPATPNHANRVIWSKQAFNHPEQVAEGLFWALLATNADQTLAQIEGASDAAIKAAVLNAIDIFADGSTSGGGGI